MAETTYKSAYTGAQIDKAVGTVLENDIPNLAVRATAAAATAETAAAKAEAAAAASEIYTVKKSNSTDSTGQETTLSRMSCFVVKLAKADGADAIRINSVGVKTTGGGTVRFALYELTDNGDGTGTLTCADILGTAEADDNLAALYGLSYYSTAGNLCLMAFAESEVLGCLELPDLTLSGTPHFDDANLYDNEIGSAINCGLDTWDSPFLPCAAANWDSVVKQAVSEFADDTSKRLNTLEESAGGTSAVVTAVDLSKYDSDGIIEETYSDGSVITYTMEFDTDGNPIRITDSNGNVTTLTW